MAYMALSTLQVATVAAKCMSNFFDHHFPKACHILAFEIEASGGLGSL